MSEGLPLSDTRPFLNPVQDPNDGPSVGLDAAAMHDELLANQPEGARHDADICPFCVDKATRNGQSSASVTPPVESDRSGAPTQVPVDTEGGTTETMSDNTKQETLTLEAHEALLEKALREATSTTEDALERKAKEAAELAAEVEQLKAKNAELTAETARLNSELDKAQIDLKAANDQAAEIKAAAEKAAADAAKAELASQRAEQVKNLGLFKEDYIAERSSRWADIAEDAWNEQLEEWRLIKPDVASEGTGAGASQDAASAMTGTSGQLTKDVDSASSTTSPRRAALGLS